MNYDTAFKILTLMGFLPHDKMPDPVDQQLLNEFWHLVKIEEHRGVTLDTLRVALLNIVGIRLPDRERLPRNEREDSENEKEGE